MAKLLGFILLIAGAVLLYLGWETHTATPHSMMETLDDPRPERSVWLLAFGAVALVWGLFALLPRRAM